MDRANEALRIDSVISWQNSVRSGPSDARSNVSIRDLVLHYLRRGSLGFGGPVALCGQMELELMQERENGSTAMRCATLGNRRISAPGLGVREVRDGLFH